jgi:serine/threonine protein kinase
MKSTSEEFAVKIVNKALIVKLDKVKSVMAERDILNRVKHPNVVELKCTFQDDENVCMSHSLNHPSEISMLCIHGLIGKLTLMQLCCV